MTYSGPNRVTKKCRYCESETCRSSAWTTSGWDVERFERLHRVHQAKHASGTQAAHNTDVTTRKGEVGG